MHCFALILSSSLILSYSFDTTNKSFSFFIIKAEFTQ